MIIEISELMNSFSVGDWVVFVLYSFGFLIGVYELTQGKWKELGMTLAWLCVLLWFLMAQSYELKIDELLNLSKESQRLTDECILIANERGLILKQKDLIIAKQDSIIKLK